MSSSKRYDREDGNHIKPRDVWASFKRTAVVFAVKPIAVIYAMIFAVTMTVNNQLWIDKVCSNNLNYTDEICSNLTLPENQKYNDEVQRTVNDYQIVQSYVEMIPTALAALYLGPMSDGGRKKVMIFPFIGHVISGICSLLNVYYWHWDARLLWLQEIYCFFGGYTVINIAMMGYIGDVTKVEERTALLSILRGLTMCLFPLADFVGGQLYTHYGYKPVYWTSFAFVIIGILYLCLIPESVKQVKVSERPRLVDRDSGVCSRSWRYFVQTNRTWISTFKTTFRYRPTGERKIILTVFFIGLLGSIRSGSNGLLYTQKKFGWTVEDYTYFSSFQTIHIAVKTLVVMPALCYLLQVHDCMLGILGAMSTIEESLVFAFATKGWMMYYGSGLSALSGSSSTPIQAIVSKCVPSTELGKVFTLFGLIDMILEYGMSAALKLVYNATIDVFPGSGYAIGAAEAFISMIMLAFLYKMISRNERRFGPLGKRTERI